jgi:chromosome segregation ATPase
MDFNKIYLFVSTLSLVVGIYLTIRDYQLRRQKAPSEKDANIAAAVNNLSNALGLTSNELVDSLTDAAKLRDELEKEREVTKIRVDDTTRHREVQEKHIADLEKQISTMHAEYQADAQRLRNDNAVLTKKVVELQQTIDQMGKRYANSKHAIERLVQALNDAHIPIPDLSGFLSDSVQIRGLKHDK